MGEIERLMNKANEKIDTGKHIDALKSLDAILKIDPNNFKALYMKAYVFMELEESKDADKIIADILILKPENTEIHSDSLNLKGVILLNEGKYRKALTIFNDSLKIDPNNLYALINKGETLNQLEKYEEAIECLNNALKIDDKSIGALTNKGTALVGIRQFPAAIQCYDKALKIDPDDTYVIYCKSTALWEHGKKEEAMDLLKAGLGRNPNDRLLLETQGEFLRDLDNPDEALKVFLQLEKFYPDYTEAWFDLGNVYKDMDKYKEAVDAYEKFVSMVRKNKISVLSTKANRVNEYVKWYKETGGDKQVTVRDPPYYWLWVTKSEFFLEDDGSDRQSLEPGSSHDPGRWWTCHKDTQAGDLILIYRAGKQSGRTFQDIKYLIMARSDSYPLDVEETQREGWNYGCDYLPLHKFDNSIKYGEIKMDPYLEEWGAYKANFHRISFDIKEHFWKHLTNVLIEKNPDYGDFYMNLDRKKFIEDYILEKEVEEKLKDNIGILNKFGYDLEFDSQQEVCIDGEGKIDLLCIDKNDGNYVVIELKVTKANTEAFGQISSYMGWLMETTNKPVKGIVISRGYDKKFHSALITNPNIEHVELSEVLLELKKI